MSQFDSQLPGHGKVIIGTDEETGEPEYVVKPPASMFAGGGGDRGAFINNRFQGSRYTNYLAIDVNGINVIMGGPRVFVVPNETSLDRLV